MEFGCSPHREGGGTMHLPSPTHRHGYGMEIPSSIQQLRRSLSRSPSKPSRFHLRRSDSGSPISPLALSRAFTPKPPTKDLGAATVDPESPFAPQFITPAQKKRFTLRRSTPFRSSPRNRAKSKSPRRVLADSTDHGNATPFATMRQPGEENATVRRNSPEQVEMTGTEQRPSMRFDIDDKPIKFGISRSRQDLVVPATPAKSSPLKRSDGIMNLDSTNLGSPVAKRRSLHGASASENDIDIFDHAPTPGTPRVGASEEESSQPQELDFGSSFSFSPIAKPQTPLRKTTSLRKSTLSQRYGANLPRSRPAFDGEFAIPGAPSSKSRQRMSFDGSFPQSPAGAPSPFRRSTNLEAMRPPSYQPFVRGASSNQPHPLSNAVTQSPSTSTMADGSLNDDPPVAPAVTPRNPGFSRSLPIGACRPFEHHPENGSSELSFETPMAFKMAKPDPTIFMSTGFISKKNRNVDAESLERYVMPGTPSKRNSFPPLIASPSTTRRSIFDTKISRPEFGQPSTPFSLHKGSSSASFGKGVSIFGSANPRHQRRSSFASIDGEENPPSPGGNIMTDSQSSVDDMPPTPTKQNDGSGRRKSSSLRRKTFRQQRASIGSDTFTAPAAPETPAIGFQSFDTPSPHTPNESFTPPDPSSLSISVQRRGSVSFNSSINSQFPPATPTAPRDHSKFFADQTGVPPIAKLTENDVDTSLTERFDTASQWGDGEFSKVYRAEKMVGRSPCFTSPTAQVFAVKKTKKPYSGPFDRDSKLKEVRILQALSGHDHIVRYEDHWEHDGYLYIQTEFCEEGNLQRFLATAGCKDRLDEFRIWKILLELASGVQHIHQEGYIHLDLKPANVLITFDGALKIADFGLANPWPAAKFIDGEGDRRYLAPEALQGRYDKPCDIFALGTIMCEVAANVDVPDGGSSWHRIRRGDLSELGSLTWSSDSSLPRDENGEPISRPERDDESTDASDGHLANIGKPSIPRYLDGLVFPPGFMTELNNPDSLQQIIQWMMNPNPDHRPTADMVYRSYGCQWVEGRARAAATIYEGNWGPDDDVLEHNDQEADMMDTS